MRLKTAQNVGFKPSRTKKFFKDLKKRTKKQKREKMKKL